jgi:predicted site-specific integrase-resolvase
MHPNTLRKYADEGKIRTVKNEAGQRLYDVKSYIRGQADSSIVLYCRVHSPEQKDDLVRQTAQLRQLYPNAEVIEDTGSALNFKRKGLQALLERLMQGDKLTLVVTSKDRLVRLGFDLIESMVRKNGGEIVVLNDHRFSSKEELTTNVNELSQYFSSSFARFGKYANKIEKDTNLSVERDENSL